MSAWARHLDDLAAATAHLLIDGAVQPQPLVDPNAAMAARDAVLVELRQLIGSVGDAPPFATVRELTLHDVGHRPAQALHQTLSELPRAVPLGTAELGAADDQALSAYERTWQQAARATIGLGAYVEVLRELPDSHAWPPSCPRGQAHRTCTGLPPMRSGPPVRSGVGRSARADRPAADSSCPHAHGKTARLQGWHHLP